MPRVDTSNWKTHPLRDIFDIVKGTRLTKNNMIDGEINYIGATAFNNGITAKIGNTNHIHPAGTITVCYNGSIGQTFYQESPFWATDDVNVLYPKFNLTQPIAQFIIPIIYKIGQKYKYTDKWTSEKMLDTEIPLPTTPSNQPDWDYMEDYIQSIKLKAIENIDLLKNIIDRNSSKIDTSTWRRFHLYDDSLFTIDSGNKLDRIKMTDNHPSINFVGRANANNGVTNYIDIIDGIKPYEAGCMTISLGGEYLGSCFIQDKPFYTSQNVNVLIPKQTMSDYCKHFIATMIFREGRLHYKAFQDELNRHMKTDFTIPLPQTENGTPDWNYMEQYMRNIAFKTQTAIQKLTLV